MRERRLLWKLSTCLASNVCIIGHLLAILVQAAPAKTFKAVRGLHQANSRDCEPPSRARLPKAWSWSSMTNKPVRIRDRGSVQSPDIHLIDTCYAVNSNIVVSWVGKGSVEEGQAWTSTLNMCNIIRQLIPNPMGYVYYYCWNVVSRFAWVMDDWCLWACMANEVSEWAGLNSFSALNPNAWSTLPLFVNIFYNIENRPQEKHFLLS